MSIPLSDDEKFQANHLAIMQDIAESLATIAGRSTEPGSRGTPVIVITRKNGPFGEVGLDADFNPPGWYNYHESHDYIEPCDQYPGGTWLKPGTWRCE